MKILTLIIGVVLLSAGAWAFEDIGYATYDDIQFSLDLPTGYVVSTDLSDLGITTYHFSWVDAYMRDFRATVIINGTSSTLPELVVAYETLMGARNRLEPHQFGLNEKALFSRGAAEGYQGLYTVEETYGEYYKNRVLYLAGDANVIFNVGAHISKEEGGLDILKRMYRSFVLK